MVNLDLNIKSSRKKLITYLTGVLIIVVVIILIASSYLNLQFLPRTVIKTVDVVIASIPAVPKTPKQVLTKAFFESSRVSSGEHYFKLNILEKTDGKEVSILTPEIKGVFEKTNDQIDFSGTVNLRDDSEINFVEKDDFVYFQIRNVPNFQNLDFSQFTSSWYKIDMTEVVSDTQAKVRSDKEIEDTVTEKSNKFLDLIISEGIIDKITVLVEEEINGSKSFRYKIVLDGDEVRKIGGEVFGVDLSTLSELTIEVWVDKSKFVFNRIIFAGALSKEDVASSPLVTLQVLDVGFNLIYELRKANEKMEIEEPQDAVELESLLDLFLLTQSKSSAQSVPKQILGAVSGIGEFGANFLTVERLLHVIYIAPLSF